jgi:regulator of RNase E activity RraA
MSKFIIADDTTINVINAAEAQIAGLKADNKANNEAANAQKISAYCELIATLAPVKLVKGNLPRAVSPRRCALPCLKRLA